MYNNAEFEYFGKIHFELSGNQMVTFEILEDDYWASKGSSFIEM